MGAKERHYGARLDVRFFAHKLFVQFDDVVTTAR